MRLTANKNKKLFYVDENKYEDKDIMKDAGFWWHPGPPRCTERNPDCRACKMNIPPNKWWTGTLSVAKKLYMYADVATQKFFDNDGFVAARSSAATVSEADKLLVEEPVVPSGTTLFDYQKAGVVSMLTRTNNLLADEMGLGKTPQTVAYINTKKFKRILVVCPASLKINWEREIAAWSEPKLSVQIINGRKALYDNASNVCIVNYDLLTGNNNALKKQLLSTRFDLLVLDEAHYIKNAESQRAKAIVGHLTVSNGMRTWSKGVAHVASHKMYLTGTPIPNRPVEGWVLFNSLDPKTFSAFVPYIERYCNAFQEEVPTPAGRMLVWNARGASNLDELNFKLRSTIMTARRKKDVLASLPPKIRQVLILDGEDAEAAVAAEKKQIEKVLGTTVSYDDNLLSKLKDSKELSFGDMAKVRARLAKAKIKPVTSIVSDCLDGGLNKIVVFAHHHELIDGLYDGLKEYGAMKLTGETSQTMRQNIVDTFQNEPEARVFIGNMQAAGVGLTLTAASTVVMAELDWVPATVTQAEDRCHRIGQKDVVNVIHTVFDGSLDSKMVGVLMRKQRVMDSAIGQITK